MPGNGFCTCLSCILGLVSLLITTHIVPFVFEHCLVQILAFCPLCTTTPLRKPGLTAWRKVLCAHLTSSLCVELAPPNDGLRCGVHVVPCSCLLCMLLSVLILTSVVGVFEFRLCLLHNGSLRCVFCAWSGVCVTGSKYLQISIYD